MEKKKTYSLDDFLFEKLDRDYGSYWDFLWLINWRGYCNTTWEHYNR